MRILAAVGGSLLSRLDYAAQRRFKLLPVKSWEEALNAILTKPLEVGVVDPALDGSARSQEIERLRVLFPSFPLILYTQLVPPVAPVLLRLGQSGVREVVVARHDDQPNRLAELLTNEASHAVSGQLIAAFSDLLDRCPAQLRWAFEAAIRDPASVPSVQELAVLARMDRRTCLRWFAKAKLPPPSVMLMVLRVVYAHRLLQDPGYTVEDVAIKLGYAQTRSLAQNVKDVLGMTPGELRVSLAPQEALARVRERYFAPAAPVQIARVS
jgi:AraC-like DNA-binding protein